MLWQIALAVFLCYFIWKQFKTEENDLARLPGPSPLPIIGCIFHFIGLPQTELFTKLTELHKDYGDRVVIKVMARYILHIYKIEDIEVVLTHSKNITKSKPYTFMEPWLGSGLLISTGAKWHRRRKILTPTFHFDILKSFMPVFEEHSRNIVKYLKRNVEEGNDVIDVMPMISDFTLYIICETAMGLKLDTDKSNAKLKYKNAILNIGPVIMERLTTIWLHNDFIFGLHPLGKKFKECLDSVHSFGDSVIMERKKNYDANNFDQSSGKRRLAFLDLLLEYEKKGEIDLEGIRDEVNTFMFEGHDTTATALSFGLMILAEYPEVQERIYKESKEIFGDSYRPASAIELGEMKYLDAVVKEILRIYPSVPFIGREVVEDFMLGDVKVKKGTEVLVHIYGLHRIEDLYPEPEKFKPERFLSGESRHPYAYVPFSAGLRNCIGQRFAKLEIKSVLSEIIRNFKLEPKVPGARPSLKADLVLRTDDPMYVRFVPR